mgnify:FL=1
MKNPVKDLNPELIEAFTLQIRGEIILPTNKEYNETRKVYNGMINKHPGMFVMCVDVADVMSAVNFGRENNLLIAIR